MEGRLQSFHGVVKGLADSRPLWKVLRVLGNVFELQGFEFNSSEQVLAEAIQPSSLPTKLNNSVNVVARANQPTNVLLRVGGVGIYHTDAIVRRSAPLQATSHAQTPVARVHSATLAQLGLQDGVMAVAKQNGASVQVQVLADDGLPKNVVHLPLHGDNAALGAMMNTIELAGA